MTWGSVRVRLMLWNVAALALVMAAFAAALAASVLAALNRSVDADLSARGSRTAHAWARGGPPPRWPGPWPGPGPPGDGLGPGPGWPGGPRPGEGPGPRGMPPPGGDGRMDVRRPRVFDRSGRPLGPPDEEPWDPAALASAAGGAEVFSDIQWEGEPFRVLSVPFRAGESPADPVLGVVQVAEPVGEQARFAASLLRTFLTLLPGGLLIAALGGLFLTGRALRPVQRLTEEAAQIGAEDLSRRLPVTGSDEIGTLAATFNGMIGRLEDAFARLRAAFEQQRRFTGNASHELRTPLTALKANTSLALSGERTVGEYREALVQADRAADLMARIVQDMLLLARSDAGQLAIERQPVDLGAAVDRAVQIVSTGLASAPPRQGAPLNIQVSASEAPPVLGDAHHLTRLFANLLGNAVRHTPPGAGIRVTASRVGDFVVVDVVDSGEGIPPEHLPHVCEPFYRVDSARSRADGGTGLGLAICQGIVEAHGGRMAIRSQVGKGTTVSIRLLAVDSPGAPASLPASESMG